MLNLKRGFRLLCRTLIMGLLVAVIGICSFSTFPANAASYPAGDRNPFEITNPTQGDSASKVARRERIAAVEDCKKYLVNGDNKDLLQSDNTSESTGYEQLSSAYRGINPSDPTASNTEFNRCLQEQGIPSRP